MACMCLHKNIYKFDSSNKKLLKLYCIERVKLPKCKQLLVRVFRRRSFHQYQYFTTSFFQDFVLIIKTPLTGESAKLKNNGSIRGTPKKKEEAQESEETKEYFPDSPVICSASVNSFQPLNFDSHESKLTEAELIMAESGKYNFFSFESPASPLFLVFHSLSTPQKCLPP